MPLVDSNDVAMWDGGPTSLYRALHNGQRVGFTRETMWNFYGDPNEPGNSPDRLRMALNLQPGQSIILVGAGFGWMAEKWQEAGLGPIVAIDSSTWIQANKAQHARVQVHNEDASDNLSRGRIKQLLGLQGNERAAFAISEDIVAGLSDQEAQVLAVRLRLLGTTTVHWITTGRRRFDDPNTWAGDQRLNWKTLEDWKVLLAPDLVVGRNENDRVL